LDTSALIEGVEGSPRASDIAERSKRSGISAGHGVKAQRSVPIGYEQDPVADHCVAQIESIYRDLVFRA
jgi:hypothetical protein